MADDDLVRAASDAVDAYCAANPAPAWPVLPEGVTAADFTTVWSGTLEHDPVEVTYTTVRDQARAMVDASPELQQSITELVQAGATEDDARGVIEALAMFRLRKGAADA